jgi:hypothetical protein
MDPRCGWRPEPGRRRVVPFIVGKPAEPFKHHAEHRHHIPKPRYRVTNWPELTNWPSGTHETVQNLGVI